MIRNFFVVTWRNLRRNGLYSTINIAGLSIGITCSVLILLWVADEATYNTFIPKYKKLNQVWVNAFFDGEVNSWNSVPLPTYEAMKTAHSDIVNTCVLGWGNDRLLTYGEKRLTPQGYYASKEFLSMFEYPLKVGEPSLVMEDPYSIVITESLAKKLFGDEDPMGRLVRVEDETSVKVTGILYDIPGNSSFEFEYLLPWKHRELNNEWVQRNKTNWGNYSFQVYVELSSVEVHDEVEASIAGMLAENGQDDIERSFFIYPMDRWRLYSDFENGKENGSGMIEYVNLFTIIASFILLIACINFMNLATARSEKRVREVGIRKSLGSTKRQLIAQFLGESLFISFIAYMIALIATILLLKPYNMLVDKELFVDYSSPIFWGFSVGVVLITGVLSGSYPALYLSSFKAIQTLKGSVFSGKKAGTPRRVLVTLQFGFSILLMFSTLVIFRQIELVKDRNLGYNQENLISIEDTEAIEENYDVLKNDLLRSGVVESVTRSNSPIDRVFSNNFLGWPGKPENERVIFWTIAAGYDYAKTMGVEVLMGRDFSREFATDTAAILVNKAALDMMQLENPIGTSLDLWGGKRKLIGVLDNIMMGSPFEEVRPMFMIFDPEWISFLTLRLKKTKNLDETMAKVEDIFTQYNPAYPFEYSFVDQDFQRKFRIITLTQRLATIFAFLAIIITGLGLFGLASYTAEQRIKEIGIRKVLGASVLSLMGLISKESTRLVLISFIITTPIAWYLLDNYLDKYPIRVSLEWWMPVVVGVVAVLFSLLVVSNQARRAALSNPSEALRNE